MARHRRPCCRRGSSSSKHPGHRPLATLQAAINAARRGARPAAPEIGRPGAAYPRPEGAEAHPLGDPDDVQITPDPRLNIAGRRRAGREHGAAGGPDPASSTRRGSWPRSRSSASSTATPPRWCDMLAVAALPAGRGAGGAAVAAGRGRAVDRAPCGSRSICGPTASSPSARRATCDHRGPAPAAGHARTSSSARRRLPAEERPGHRRGQRAINDSSAASGRCSRRPRRVSPFQQIESEVVVVPEPVSNSLIISATPRFFEDISNWSRSSTPSRRK